jgi:cytochrome bd ubiquinol oxidase subunit II
MLAFVAVAFAGALWQRASIPTNLFDRIWGLIFPLVGLLAIRGVFVGVRQRRDTWPFFMSALFFISAFAMLAVLFWPFMIPYAITISAAAAPEAHCPSCSGAPVCSCYR